MKFFFFIQILIQKVSSIYLEVFYGTKELSDDHNAIIKELSFTKRYYCKGKRWLYIMLLKNNLTETNEFYVLILALPITKEESENDEIVLKKEKLRTKLGALFHNSGFIIFRTTWLVKIYIKEDRYLCFYTFLNFEIILKLSDNKLYSYSEHDLVEFPEDHPVLSEIEYGVKEYNTALYFNKNFMLIRSKIIHISYLESSLDRNELTAKFVVRKFFADSIVIWAETITEQGNVFLTREPTLEFDRFEYAESTNEVDEFAARVGLYKVGFLFGFYEKAEADPKVRVEGGEIFDTAITLKKLVFFGMNVTKFTLKNFFVFHFVVPKFFYKETFGAEYIIFLMHYDSNKHSESFENSFYISERVFYPLTKPEISFELDLEGGNPFFVTLKRIFENDCLSFLIEAKIVDASVEHFELPLVPDKSYPELQYVYTALQKPLEKAFNGALVKPMVEEKEQKTQKKSPVFFEKSKMIIVMVIVMLCLLIFVYILVRIKIARLEERKQKFKALHK